MSSRKLLVEHLRSRISVSLCWIRGWLTILAVLAVMPDPCDTGLARSSRVCRTMLQPPPTPRPILCPSNERHAAVEDNGLPGRGAVAYCHGDGVRDFGF